MVRAVAGRGRNVAECSIPPCVAGSRAPGAGNVGVDVKSMTRVGLCAGAWAVGP